MSKEFQGVAAVVSRICPIDQKKTSFRSEFSSTAELDSGEGGFHPQKWEGKTVQTTAQSFVSPVILEFCCILHVEAHPVYFIS